MPKLRRDAALRYFGGKARMARKILPYFPGHVCFVDAYGGGASLTIQKAPVHCEVYNDIYHEVVNFFQILREWRAEGGLQGLELG